MAGFGQLFGRDAARIHASTAYPYDPVAPGDRVEHHLDVVESLRHFLIPLGASCRIADQKDAHLFALALHELPGKA